MRAEGAGSEGLAETGGVEQRLHADPGVLVGYSGTRTAADELLLGTDARLRSGTVLYAGSRIGARFQTGHHVVVREECQIGDDVSIWSNTVVDYGCRIGNRVKIHSNCYIAQYTEILDDAFFAPGVTVANDLYPGQAESARLMSGPLVGDGCLVGGGSVVTHDLPPGMVAFGNPARVRGRVADLLGIGERVVPDPTSAARFSA